MAPLEGFSLKKVLFLLLLLFVFFCSTFISAYQPNSFGGRRSMLEVEEEDEPVIKKKTTSTKLSSLKNTTKVSKSITGSIKNQTKLINLPSDSTKNKTKLIKSTSDGSTPTIKSQLKKLNSTSKTSNSTATKTSSLSTKKSSDLNKLSSSPKNKTTKPTIISKETKTKAQLEKSLSQSKSKNPEKTQPKKAQKQSQPSWIDQDDEDDLVSGFRDLPSKFQETLLPDLERISKTSKVYLTKYNKEFTKGFKPYVGNKYAPMIASIASFAFILIPLLLVSLIFNRIKAYFSLQKLLIFIQAYLAIYFSILCLSSLVTGLEPVKFFYATSQSTYVCVQVLQTLAYVLYLLLLLMYLILVFSTETGLATKLLGLGQTFVGFAVGLHYYMTVFHRAVLHQPPKTSSKVHALYATCFLVICALGRVDRRKKAYVEEDGEEGKKS
ncbi:Mediator of RNA polymerase II transcription subunit 26 [Olea europaea subsp. europaea]|uniref:Mediator of RNA polymerase II transcription subunit 26 n=1 Tax=Olea europaea subsp. europaea TaxID=158383 RepID=A0A8S0T2V8_OLEEU|nr:Mediator of RNA polymerase II transcription subunit 26 [Olea europaea subsp. europaea]